MLLSFIFGMLPSFAIEVPKCEKEVQNLKIDTIHTSFHQQPVFRGVQDCPVSSGDALVQVEGCIDVVVPPPPCP